jgi:NarL family two-component system sensor histidine kinase LiaS
MQVAAAQSLIDRDPDAAKVRLSQAERLVSQAQRELTTLIQELRPAALAGKGLGAALRDYCADWSRQSGILAALRLFGEQHTPLAVEQALFRVAQEALANVARHSGAAAVDVHLAWTEQQLCLSVEDNGHGFCAAEADGAGIGLRSMRERVEGLGGTLLVGSSSSGTSLSACLPIPLSATGATAVVTAESTHAHTEGAV